MNLKTVKKHTKIGILHLIEEPKINIFFFFLFINPDWWIIFSIACPNSFKLAFPCSSRFKINGMRVFLLPKFENLFSTLFKTRKYRIVVDVNVAVEELFIHENSYLLMIIIAVLHFLMEIKEKEEEIWERRGERRERRSFFNYYYLFNHWWVGFSFNFKIKKDIHGVLVI